MDEWDRGIKLKMPALLPYKMPKHLSTFLILCLLMLPTASATQQKLQEEKKMAQNFTVSFFEEFPTEENLEKINLITFSTKLYIAAQSYDEFLLYKSRIQAAYPQVKEIIYWPTLSKSEGYWISPFAKRHALARIFDELKNKTEPVMLDLEYPRNVLLYPTQLFQFKKNKQLIADFAASYQGPLSLAEYEVSHERLLQKFGLSFNGQGDGAGHTKKPKVIKMWYHSMRTFREELFREEIKKDQELFGKENLLVALGTIATGISGRERILAPEELARDLKIAKELGVQEVVVFRLGGWEKRYAEVIENCAD